MENMGEDIVPLIVGKLTEFKKGCSFHLIFLYLLSRLAKPLTPPKFNCLKKSTLKITL